MPTRTATRPNVNPFDKQIENRNFLSPVGFRFSLSKGSFSDMFTSLLTFLKVLYILTIVFIQVLK